MDDETLCTSCSYESKHECDLCQDPFCEEHIWYCADGSHHVCFECEPIVYALYGRTMCSGCADDGPL